VIKTAKNLGVDKKTEWILLKQVSAFLANSSQEVTPPETGRDVYRIIAETTGIRDPYQKIKKACTQQALELYPMLKQAVRDSADPLKTAVKAAIAGNVIDFGITREFDLKKDVDDVLGQEFALDFFPEFRKKLGEVSEVLFLADNAGETVFDRVLIEEIKQPVVYAVRERPIINDATVADALDAGIDKVAKVISSGCDVPGTHLNSCSPSFRRMFSRAEMIISKGQGNYECLSEVEGPVFFLLKVKCNVVARDMGVREGRIVLLKARQMRF